jgi:N-acetylglutamate synthase/N-acetylornithine aminotransferase
LTIGSLACAGVVTIVLHTVHTKSSPQVTIGGKQVHIGGMCKGSGMIHHLSLLTCTACGAAIRR